MPAPVFTEINFSASDQPYDGGQGYQEKMQALSQNFTLVSDYLVTVEEELTGYQSQLDAFSLQLGLLGAPTGPDFVLAGDTFQFTGAFTADNGTFTSGITIGAYGITGVSNDPTMAGDSATLLVTQQAVNGFGTALLNTAAIHANTKMPLAGGSFTGLVNFRLITSLNASFVINTETTGNTAYVVHSDSDSPAFFSFHRNGTYATHFGLDIDNYLKMGGWSDGSVSRFAIGLDHSYWNGAMYTPVAAVNTQINWRYQYMYRDINGTVNFTQGNVPLNANVAVMVLELNYISGVANLPANWRPDGGVAPELIPGINLIVGVTRDAGANVRYVRVNNKGAFA